MGVYIGFLIYVFVLWILFKYSNMKNYDKIYIVLVGIAIAFLVICRSLNVGNDTYVYARRFELFDELSWSKAIAMGNYYNFEYGFTVFCKIISYFINGGYTFVTLVSLFVVFSLCRFFYKYSVNPFFSIIIFVSLGFFSETFNLLRQFLAIAILLFAIDAIIEKKLLKFLIIVFLAGCIHSSAFLFVIAYFFVYFEYSYKIVAVYFVGIVCLLTLNKTLIINLIKKTSYAKYMNSNSSNGSVGLTILYFIFVAILIFLLSKESKENKFVRVILGASFVSFAIVVLTFSVQSISRLCIYFSIVFSVSVPYAVSKINNKLNKYIIEFGCIAILIAYYFMIVLKNDTAGIIPYEFIFNTIE